MYLLQAECMILPDLPEAALSWVMEASASNLEKASI